MSRILDSAHESMLELYESGFISIAKMQRYKVMCKKTASDSAKKLREIRLERAKERWRRLSNAQRKRWAEE